MTNGYEIISNINVIRDLDYYKIDPLRYAIGKKLRICNKINSDTFKLQFDDGNYIIEIYSKNPDAIFRNGNLSHRIVQDGEQITELPHDSILVKCERKENKYVLTFTKNTKDIILLIYCDNYHILNVMCRRYDKFVIEKDRKLLNILSDNGWKVYEVKISGIYPEVIIANYKIRLTIHKLNDYYYLVVCDSNRKKYICDQEDGIKNLLEYLNMYPK